MGIQLRLLPVRLKGLQLEDHKETQGVLLLLPLLRQRLKWKLPPVL
jgi:hypothetical protein